MKSGVREGDIVYMRAVATRSATVYNDGVACEGITLIPISRDGTRHEYISAPAESVISKNAIESSVTRVVKERYGIK